MPEFVNRLTPVVEVAWSSPASKPNQGSTQYLIGVGHQLHGGDLCGQRRGADPRQQADRLARGRDRAVPSLLRRPVPEQPRQADRGLVATDAARLPARGWRCCCGIARLRARVPGARQSAGRQRGRPPRRPSSCITFTEGVEPLFSTIEVRDANGAAVSTGKPHVAPDNDRRLVVELPKLPPGTYTVIWHVTSVDTHKTEGSYPVHRSATVDWRHDVPRSALSRLRTMPRGIGDFQTRRPFAPAASSTSRPHAGCSAKRSIRISPRSSTGRSWSRRRWSG